MLHPCGHLSVVACGLSLWSQAVHKFVNVEDRGFILVLIHGG